MPIFINWLCEILHKLIRIYIKTKQLAQYSVPAENSRVIRVFLSSTFRDMEMERSALVKLFKGLQVKAASRGGTISLVDLRWGITEEDAKSGLSS